MSDQRAYGKSFDFEIDGYGVFVVFEGKPITSLTLSEDEIDRQIAKLKESLDDVGMRMKAALRNQLGRGSFGD